MLVKKKILIFTATYNEKDNIEPLIRSINFHNPEVDILIIDDNSLPGSVSMQTTA